MASEKITIDINEVGELIEVQLNPPYDISHAEAIRVNNELGRTSSESIRLSNEQDRIDQELIRQSNEENRQNNTNETIQSAAAATIIANASAAAATSAASSANTAATNASNTNTSVQQSESSRVTAEQGRVSAESGRVSTEQSRVTSESSRASAESTRAGNETTRQSQETGRVNAESSRVTAESSRVTVESARVTAEQGRASAETTRGSNETTRQSQETTRQSNESTRISQESARVAAENARVAAGAVIQTQIKQTTGTSTTEVMSQKAVSDELMSLNNNIQGSIYLSISDFSNVGLLNRNTGNIDVQYIGWFSTNKLQILNPAIITFSGLWGGDEGVHSSVIFYDENEDVVSYSNIDAGSLSNPAGAKFVAFSTNQANCSVLLYFPESIGSVRDANIAKNATNIDILQEDVLLLQDYTNVAFRELTKEDCTIVGVLSSTGAVLPQYDTYRTSEKIYLSTEYVAFSVTAAVGAGLGGGTTVCGLVVYDINDNVLAHYIGLGLIKMNGFDGASYIRVCYFADDLYLSIKIIKEGEIFNPEIVTSLAKQMIAGDMFCKTTYPTNYIDGKSIANGRLNYAGGAIITQNFTVPDIGESVDIFLSDIPINVNTRQEGTKRTYLFDVDILIGVGAFGNCDVYKINSFDLNTKKINCTLVHNNLDIIGDVFVASSILNSGTYQAKIFLLQDAIIYNVGGLPYAGSYDTYHPLNDYYNYLADSIISRLKDKNGGVFPATTVLFYGDSFLHFGEIANRVGTITGVTTSNNPFSGWDIESIAQQFINTAPNNNDFYVFVFGTNNFTLLTDNSLHAIRRLGYTQILSETLSLISSYLPFGNWLCITGHCGSNRIIVDTDILT